MHGFAVIAACKGQGANNSQDVAMAGSPGILKISVSNLKNHSFDT